MESQESYFSSSQLSKDETDMMKISSFERFKLSSLAVKVYESKLLLQIRRNLLSS